MTEFRYPEDVPEYQDGYAAGYKAQALSPSDLSAIRLAIKLLHHDYGPLNSTAKALSTLLQRHD